MDVLTACYYLNVQEENSTLEEVFYDNSKINIIFYPCRPLIEEAPNKIRTRVNIRLQWIRKLLRYCKVKNSDKHLMLN